MFQMNWREGKTVYYPDPKEKESKKTVEPKVEKPKKEGGGKK